jgi:hypothetical protein
MKLNMAKWNDYVLKYNQINKEIWKYASYAAIIRCRN